MIIPQVVLYYNFEESGYFTKENLQALPVTCVEPGPLNSHQTLTQATINIGLFLCIDLYLWRATLTNVLLNYNLIAQDWSVSSAIATLFAIHFYVAKGS